MNKEAASKQLGRLLGTARDRAADAIVTRTRSGPRNRTTEIVSVGQQPVAVAYDRGVIDVDLSEALARAEAAEAEVERLRRELARKDEVIKQAREALTGARIALSDHLRITSS